MGLFGIVRIAASFVCLFAQVTLTHAAATPFNPDAAERQIAQAQAEGQTQTEAYAEALEQLGIYRFNSADYAKAGNILQDALMVRTQLNGANSPKLFKSLFYLARYFEAIDQKRQARPLYERLVEIMRTAKPDSLEYANSLYFLAKFYQSARASGFNAEQDAQASDVLTDLPDSTPLLKEALRIYDEKEGKDSMDSAWVYYALTKSEAYSTFTPELIGNLNHALRIARQHGQGESVLAYRILETLQYATTDLDQSNQIRSQMEAMATKVFGPADFHSASYYFDQASTYELRHQYVDALNAARNGSAFNILKIENNTEDANQQEAVRYRAGFLKELSLLSLNPEHLPDELIANESFKVGQLIQGSSAASALDKLWIRSLADNGPLADKIREAQDLRDHLNLEERQLLAKVVNPDQADDADTLKALQDQIQADKARAKALKAEIEAKDPKYGLLVRNTPMSVAEVQQLLKPDEAVVSYVLAWPSYMWVITAHEAHFLARRIFAKDLEKDLKTIRQEMSVDAQGKPNPVQLDLLYQLYRTVFRSADKYLDGISHVMIVPYGPLVGLPFGMMIASPPSDNENKGDYSSVDWLTKHYAFSVLPSVRSLQIIRRLGAQPPAAEPFAGFGDPTLAKVDVKGQSRGVVPDMTTLFRNLAPGKPLSSSDLEIIRAAPSLPDTANELKAMAKILGATPGSVWLGNKATEATVKTVPLWKYRVISFATHGVMAGELPGVGEPGLILTPPKTPSTKDDGYLSSPEILKLKLNADLVILSACNTAASDGTPGAQGLSGLARAFLYAGAHSLLVSNWSVASDATTMLTTNLLKYYSHHVDQGQARALQAAQQSMIYSISHPEYAHPLFWAPFSLVGGVQGSAKQYH